MNPKLAFRSIGLFVLSLAGCATATGPSEGTDAGPVAHGDAGTAMKDSAPTKKTVPDAAATGSDASTTTNDSGAPIDDTTCAAETTKAQCEQCCLTVHPVGYAVYHQELVDCACTTPAACATECATELCANQPTTTGGACEQCINASLAQTGACYNAIAGACQGDSDCTTLFGTCIPPCESK